MTLLATTSFLALTALVILLLLLILFTIWPSVTSLELRQDEQRLRHYWEALMGTVILQIVLSLAMPASSLYRTGIYIEAIVVGLSLVSWALLRKRKVVRSTGCRGK